ncbi:MAG TPA: DUF1003 domain-containing protein [Actinopolymorphaceae bacterium]
MSARATRERLDQPRRPGRALPRFELEPDFFGRFSERFARFLGTGGFLAGMTVFVVGWIGWNTLLPEELRFDPYPFIFLVLMLSLQASYAAPLILLAQNRQEARDRVQYEQDREVAAQTRADLEFLSREIASLRLAASEVATRDYLRSELRAQLSELSDPSTASEPSQPGRRSS